MRYTISFALTVALSALLPSAFAAAPGGVSTPVAQIQGATHDPSLDVTSNGVTKTKLGNLYKSDLVVVDVDLKGLEVKGAITNLQAGSGIVLTDIPGGKKISATGGGGGGGVTEEGVNLLIGAYDATNLTPRIDQTLTDVVAGEGVTVTTNGRVRVVSATGGGGGGADTNAVNDLIRAAVAVTNAADFTSYDDKSLVGRVMNSNVVISVTGRILTLADRGTVVWSSASGLAGLTLTNVVGRLDGGRTVFDVAHGNLSSVSVRPDPMPNVVSVTFPGPEYGNVSAECRVLLKCDWPSATVTAAGLASDVMVGSNTFRLDPGYHMLTVTRIARDTASGTNLAYAEIHRLD